MFFFIDHILYRGLNKKLLHQILLPGKFFTLFVDCLFFQNQLFRKVLLGIPSECQTDLGPNYLQRLSADATQ